MRRWLLLGLLFCAPRLHAQTQIQSFAADPATCDSTRGLLYYNTITQQFKSCGPSPNTWSVFGSGGVSNIATTLPITGGPITTTGTIACPTCITSVSGTRVIYAGDPQWAGGVQGDGAYSCVAVMTNGSQTVTTDPGTSTITNTVLTGNVATISSVQNFQVGDTISITGTTNGGGAFNVTNVVITVAVPGSNQFSFALVHANIGSAVDTGTVQGPSIDKPFVNAPIASGGDIGDIVFGTNMNCAGQFGFDFSTSTLIVPVGTITAVNNAHSVQVSIPATATCNGSVNTGVSCQFGWFRHDDTVALQTAFNAAVSMQNGQSGCSTLVIPVGNILFSSPIVNQTTRCGVQVATEASPIEQGFSVIGQGPGQTRLIPSPSLDASTAIPNGAGARILFGTPYVQSVNFADFSVNGLGSTQLLNGNGKCILTLGWNSSIRNVSVTNWGNLDTNTNIALCSSAAIGGPNYITNFMDYNGGARCAQLENYSTASGLQCLTFLGATMFIGEIYTVDSYFATGQTGNFAAVKVGAGVTWKSSNDFVQVPSFGAWGVDDQGVMFASNLHISGGGNSGNGGGIWLDGTGATNGIAHISNSQLSSTAGGPAISANGSASGTYFDGCGNSIDATSGAVVATNISFFGSCSVTGKALVTGNVVLTSGWSSSTRAADTVPGSSQRGRFTITLAGSPTTGAVATVTFPVAFYSAPICTGSQIGGTQVLTSVVTGTPTASAVTLTYNGTLAAGNTIDTELICSEP